MKDIQHILNMDDYYEAFTKWLFTREHKGCFFSQTSGKLSYLRPCSEYVVDPSYSGFLDRIFKRIIKMRDITSEIFYFRKVLGMN